MTPDCSRTAPVLQRGMRVRTHFGATARVTGLRPLVVTLDQPRRDVFGKRFRRIAIHPRDVEVLSDG